jgi:hypothetical protein
MTGPETTTVAGPVATPADAPPPRRIRVTTARWAVENGSVLTDRCPLFGLRLTTSRLELRLPREDDLADLADLAAGGMHELSARPFFSLIREIHTFSRLGPGCRAAVIGAEMRYVVLHLAFAGLGATHAPSGAFDDNLASLRVSEKLGYVPHGIERAATPDGVATTTVRLRLTRERWAANEAVPVTITGPDACLPMFADGRR